MENKQSCEVIRHSQSWKHVILQTVKGDYIGNLQQLPWQLCFTLIVDLFEMI